MDELRPDRILGDTLNVCLLFLFQIWKAHDGKCGTAMHYLVATEDGRRCYLELSCDIVSDTTTGALKLLVYISHDDRK